MLTSRITLSGITNFSASMLTATVAAFERDLGVSLTVTFDSSVLTVSCTAVNGADSQKIQAYFADQKNLTQTLETTSGVSTLKVEQVQIEQQPEKTAESEEDASLPIVAVIVPVAAVFVISAFVYYFYCKKRHQMSQSRVFTGMEMADEQKVDHMLPTMANTFDISNTRHRGTSAVEVY